MSRLGVILFLALLNSQPPRAPQGAATPPGPELVQIPAEVAATHIVKRGKPVYPAFAKAVGIQGTVRIGIQVGPDGHINATQPVTSGWVCLEQAARDAASRYKFRPFEKDGRAVLVETSVDAVFKLRKTGKVFNPPPPPSLLDTWDDFRNAKPADDLSPELAKAVAAYLRASDFSEEAPDYIFAVEIPTKNPSNHLYAATEKSGTDCGTGGCPFQLLEQSAQGVRLLAATRPAWGFSAHPHPGSIYPDVFVGSSVFRRDGVIGYSEVGGEWIILYCTAADGTSLQVCR